MSNQMSSQVMTPPSHLPWRVRKELLENPLPYLVANPRKFKCTICQEDDEGAVLAPRISSIRLHFSSCHSDIFEIPKKFPKDTQSLLNLAIQEASYEPYTKHQSEANKKLILKWCCTSCDVLFARKDNWRRHTQRCDKASGSLENTPQQRVQCYELKFGGYCRVPIEAAPIEADFNSTENTIDSTVQGILFSNPTFNMPSVARFNAEDLKKRVVPLLQDSEDLGTWHKVMATFLARSDRIEWATDLLQELKVATKYPHQTLQMWFLLAENYFDKFPTILSVIPGNVKAHVQSFEQTVGEDGRYFGFKERLSYVSVNRYFKSLISFLLLKQCPLARRYSAEFVKEGFTIDAAFNKGFIPLFLFELCSQNMTKVGETNWMLQHAQLQMLFIKEQTLKLHECGYASQKLATILHTVRTAALGKVALMTHNGNLSKFQVEVSKIQQSLTVQMISPHISLLRTMYRSKPNTRRVRVDEHSNILVDTVIFPRRIWHQLIPKVYDRIMEELDKFFEGMLHCDFCCLLFNYSSLTLCNSIFRR